MRTPEEIDAILDKVEDLLNQYAEADDKFQRKGWNEKYSEKLGPYVDKLKAINGDDFDLFNESYDEYHRDYSTDLTDDEYTDALVKNIDGILGKLKTALEDGNVEKAKEAVEEIEEKVEEEKEPEVEETEVTVEKPAEETPVEEDSKEDELGDFEKEVEAAKERYSRG